MHVTCSSNHIIFGLNILKISGKELQLLNFSLCNVPYLSVMVCLLANPVLLHLISEPQIKTWNSQGTQRKRYRPPIRNHTVTLCALNRPHPLIWNELNKFTKAPLYRIELYRNFLCNLLQFVFCYKEVRSEGNPSDFVFKVWIKCNVPH